MNNRLRVYLAELAHNGFGLSIRTVPLGVGYVYAYCKKVHGNNTE